jgi:hypothetical protein
MKRYLTLFVAFLLSIVLIACVPTENSSSSSSSSSSTSSSNNNPVSIEITNITTTIEPGSYNLEVSILPSSASQEYTAKLVGTYDYISLTDNTLVIADLTPNGYQFKLKVSAKLDPTVYVEKQITVSNPTPPVKIITTEQELRDMALTGRYQLGNDITLTEEWIPLGTPDNEDAGIIGEGFSGILDGNGYVIRNLTTASDGYNKGFFNQIDKDGIVKNIGFESEKTPGSGIRAQAWSAVVAGSNKGLISNVYTDVLVEMAGVPGASLVGSNYGTIEYCYTIGKVTVDTGTHGSGLVNSTGSGTIISSYVLNTTTNSAISYNKVQHDQIQKSEVWMKTAQNYINAGWNQDIWYLADGSYPILKSPDFTTPTLTPYLGITNTEKQLDYRISEQRQLQITYLLANVTNTDVTFKLESDVFGASISETGLLTLSAGVENQSLVTVVITSVEEPTLSAKLSLTILNDVSSTFIDISTKDELLALANATNPAALSKYYRLTSDIDLESEDWLTPIGATVNLPFTGIFDGNGYKIKNLAHSTTDPMNDYGLFKTIGSTGIVRNLTVEISESVQLNVRAKAAVLTYQNDGLVENVLLKGDIRSTGVYVASFAYYNYGTIKNSLSLVRIFINESSTTKSTVRGLVSTHGTTAVMENVFVDKELTGVVNVSSGSNPAIDVLAKTTNELKTAATYAGFDTDIWYIVNGEYPILKSPNFEEPTLDVFITITNTESTLDYRVESERSLQITYIIDNATNMGVTFELVLGANGVTLSESGLLTLSADVENNTTIKVKVISSQDPTKSDTKTFIILNATSDGYVNISSKDDLLLLATTTNPVLLSQNYRLTSDIDLDGFDWINPIGASANAEFTGIFDGNGHTIKNFGHSTTGIMNEFGLFKTIGAQGVVKNLSIEISETVNLNVMAKSAVLAQRNDGLIENVLLKGDIRSSGVYVASFAYYNYGTIKNSLSLVRIFINESSTTMSTVRGLVSTHGTTAVMENVFVDKTLTGIVSVSSSANSAIDNLAKSTVELQTASTYSGFDTSIWNIVDGSYPTLIPH